MANKKYVRKILYAILFFELLTLFGTLVYRTDLVDFEFVESSVFYASETIHNYKINHYKSLKGTSMKCPDCNIILIAMEVARADHFGSYGYYRNTTPNINRLASRGLLFDNNFAQAGWTLPSQMSMFTSLYPTAHGVTGNKKTLPSYIITLPQILKDDGFATAGVVSHFYMQRRYGFDGGFDYYQDNDSMMETTADKVNEDVFRWLNNNFDKQFFLYIFYFDVHFPYTPPKPFDTTFFKGESNFSKHNWLFPPFDSKAAAIKAWSGLLNISNSTIRGVFEEAGTNKTTRERLLKERFNLTQEEYRNLRSQAITRVTVLLDKHQQMRDTHNDDLAGNRYNLSDRDIQHGIALYDGEIAFVDSQIGELMKRLEELNLMQNTIIMVTSGHGESLGEHGLLFTHNGMYDEILKVPLVMYIPEIKSSRRINSIVRNIDVYPTILDILGIEQQSNIQGISLLPVIEQKYSVDFYAIAGAPNLVELAPYAVRTREWKIICGPFKCELYNLENDPTESWNVNEKFPFVVRKLNSVYQRETVGNYASKIQSIEIDEETKERLKSQGYWK